MFGFSWFDVISFYNITRSDGTLKSVEKRVGRFREFAKAQEIKNQLNAKYSDISFFVRGCY